MPSDIPNVVWMNLDKLNHYEGASVQMFDLTGDFEAAREISGKFKTTKPIEFQKAGTAVTWKPAH